MTDEIRSEIRKKITELRAWLKQLEWSIAEEPKARAALARYEAAAAAFGEDVSERKRARHGLAREMVLEWALASCAAASPSKAARRNIAEAIHAKGPIDPNDRCPDLETIRGEVDFVFANWPPLPGSPNYERWERKPKAQAEDASQTLPSA